MTEDLRGLSPVLVTGAAGFIGFHLARRLLRDGVRVIGLDCLTPYYDVALKRARLAELAAMDGFIFLEFDIADRDALDAAFRAHRPPVVAHLAAQAGVRHSVENPHAYVRSNLAGFVNVLEACRAFPPHHLVYASSSSVYGGNRRTPFSEGHGADHPVSLYAATKRADELMAHAYADLYGLPATGLRFFTVYGPWGRPDMAYWSFADAIMTGRPVTLNNGGDMARDFTYIDDVVWAVHRLLARPPAPDPHFDRDIPDPGLSWAPHRIYNVGNDRPETLRAFVAVLEEAIGSPAQIVLRGMPIGDVERTWADISRLAGDIGYAPKTTLADGLRAFVAWRRGWPPG